MHTEGPSPRVSLSQTLWAVKLPIQFNQTYVSHTLKDGSVVKNLPMDQSLVWKDLTCCRASKPMCHYYEAHVLEPESCNN